MKQRIKYLIIITVLLVLVFAIVSAFITARDKKIQEQIREQEKIEKDNRYIIKRNNNKYVIKSSKLSDKKLDYIYYDSYNVYLYYDSIDKATLLKYNIKDNKIVVLFEDDPVIHGGMNKLSKYFIIGNKVYNNKFEFIKDYSNEEYIFPNLKQRLIKNNDIIYREDFENDNNQTVLTEIVKDTEDIKYFIYSIKKDGKFYILRKETKDNNYLEIYDNNNILIESFKIDKENTANYYLLDDVPYLVKEYINNKNILTYNIYNATNKENIYNSDENCSNYIFDYTKLICNTNDKKIKLYDYVTKEEKILLDSTKKVNNFILSKDYFSLLLTFEDKNNEFYIFYL